MVDFKTINKSKQFYEFLKDEILRGEYKSDSKFPSIRELSKKYGLSTVTVNSVISRLVEQGYLYSEQGRGTFIAELGLRSAKDKKMIGVMFYDFRMENNIESAMFSSIQENLKDNYFLIPYNIYDNIELFYKGLKGFSELDVNGLILVPPSYETYEPDKVRDLIPKDIPVVFINRNISTVTGDYISMDFKYGAYLAVKHLFDKGRRKILLINHNSPSIRKNILDGYIRAHEELNVLPDKEVVLECPNTDNGLDEKFCAKLTEVLKENRDITGMIASDIIIYKYRKCIAEAKRIIPDDLAVVGINDSVYARFMDPPLTAVPFPAVEIGRMAAKLITERIEGKKYPPVYEYISTGLIERRS